MDIYYTGNEIAASTTDSYKASQYGMWNDEDYNEHGNLEKLVGLYAYIEPRKAGIYQEVVVAGIQTLADDLDKIRITSELIEKEKDFYSGHFGSTYVFDSTIFKIIATEYGGRIPMRVRGLPEGSIVMLGTPIVSLESTDIRCANIVSWYEGLVQRRIWYASTVATVTLAYQKVLHTAASITATNDKRDAWKPFAHHNFGDRGCVNLDAAITSGEVHLYFSMGSDTVSAIKSLMAKTGDGKMLAYSVPAIEHNQAMSNGEENQYLVLTRALKKFSTGILSYLTDTYGTPQFVDMVSNPDSKFRKIIESRDGKFVLRPDSQTKNSDGMKMTKGYTCLDILQRLEKNGVKITINEKSFKVLDSKWGLIYGDGLTPNDCDEICSVLIHHGWCVTNMIFGTGGNLVQENISRNTLDFAMKASEQTFEVTDITGNTWKEVRETCKETPGKESKKGRVCEDGFRTFYENNKISENYDTIYTIRERIIKWRSDKNY